MSVIQIGVVAAVYSAALYGWGCLGERMVRARWPWPMTICLGLAICITLGGVANMMAVAHVIVLDGIVLLGLAAAGVSIWKSAGPGLSRMRDDPNLVKGFLLRVFPTSVLISAVFVFTAITQVPPKAFNIHDDLEKYLSHPLRMLATGTLNGGPFSALGTETLGGQAFLHGFIAAHWSIGNINAVDALFGLILALTVVLIAADRARSPAWLAPLAVAPLIFINPQYVNTSALYTGVALLLFLVFLPFGENEDRESILFTSSGAAVVGIIYAALVAVKPTFLLVILVHFLLSAAAVAWTTRRLRSVSSWCFTTVTIALGSILPWMIIHATRWYDTWSARGIFGAAEAENGGAAASLPTVDLFSAEQLFLGFGASFAHYTEVVVVVYLWCVLIVFHGRRQGRDEDGLLAWSVVSCATLLIFYLVIVLVVGRFLLGYNTALRYACPVFLAVAPAAAVFAGKALSTIQPKGIMEKLRPWPAVIVIALPTALLSWAFFEPLVARIEQAVAYGHVLSFRPWSQSPVFLGYNQFALSAKAKSEVSSMQHLIPEGETLVAWISLPLHLDYRRNRIFDVQPAGLGAPMQDFPFGGDADEGIEYFRRHGVRYVLWQYTGAAVRNDGELMYRASKPFAYNRRSFQNTLAFNGMLLAVSKRSEILHDDGTYLLFRVSTAL